MQRPLTESQARNMLTTPHILSAQHADHTTRPQPVPDIWQCHHKAWLLMQHIPYILILRVPLRFGRTMK